jgi:protocatechuate 3,4-dioxygenase alpha subunit
VTNDLVTPDTEGERIVIFGRLLDGDGVGIPDAMIEIWQADAGGRYQSAVDPRRPSNAAFIGFGRSETAGDGAFSFRTIAPGPVPGPNGAVQAPHIVVSVFARGMLNRLVTRIYFDDDPRHAGDPVLACVPEGRRSTLIAVAQDGRRYAFDIRLQGLGETVFFDV